jgi:hypothetical protein
MHKYEVYVHPDLLEDAMPKSGVLRKQILVFSGAFKINLIK